MYFEEVHGTNVDKDSEQHSNGPTSQQVSSRSSSSKANITVQATSALQPVAKCTRAMDITYIWTDGSCIQNGRSGASSGIGVYFADNDARNTKGYIDFGRQTNNRAELCAILVALCLVSLTEHVVIYTDSQYSINCITKYSAEWEIRGWKTRSGKDVEWINVIKYILAAVRDRKNSGSRTEFRYTKGHSTDHGNNSADLLARDAATHKQTSNLVSFLRHRCAVPFE